MQQSYLYLRTKPIHISNCYIFSNFMFTLGCLLVQKIPIFIEWLCSLFWFDEINGISIESVRFTDKTICSSILFNEINCTNVRKKLTIRKYFDDFYNSMQKNKNFSVNIVSESFTQKLAVIEETSRYSVFIWQSKQRRNTLLYVVVIVS